MAKKGISFVLEVIIDTLLELSFIVGVVIITLILTNPYYNGTEIILPGIIFGTMFIIGKIMRETEIRRNNVKSFNTSNNIKEKGLNCYLNFI